MIPSSRLVPTSLNKGRPVVLDEPSSEVSQSISNLATRFAGGADAGRRALEGCAGRRRQETAEEEAACSPAPRKS